eukprot:CAMPEP_0119558376 /NCGR_PEP_ID=MMETSP1352-20130426/10748_1 /TAXON_ID=265584 /ORGANISM="Stauroneis constricta, Strain CCMP1120" /LENGTH=295 /DNA_ID=CAMNT_0007605721 /DNA_START=63 /DNA_END=950 /DNA_ORIENTATION=+
MSSSTASSKSLFSLLPLVMTMMMSATLMPADVANAFTPSNRNFNHHRRASTNAAIINNNDDDASSSRPSTTALFYVTPEDSSKPSTDVVISRTDKDHDDVIATDTENGPAPELNALAIVNHCMDSLQNCPPRSSMEVCFDFSSDRCRAAVGGSLEAFINYASNPVFGTMVHCDSYEVISVGPLIPGGQHRGAMQTVLVEIKRGLTVNDALRAAEKEMQAKKQRPGRLSARKQLAEEERTMRENRSSDEMPMMEPQDDPHTRRFLWTLQQERRPPRQNCWLVHEVLFTKNAYDLTL